jgi:hypothetical protein
MCGAVPPLLYTLIVWCLVKNKLNFTFTLSQHLQRKTEESHEKLQVANNTATSMLPKCEPGTLLLYQRAWSRVEKYKNSKEADPGKICTFTAGSLNVHCPVHFQTWQPSKYMANEKNV